MFVMITLKVNDTSKTFPKGSTVNQLIEVLNIQSNGIAVAINDNIIKKNDWETHPLKDNDKILIIRSTQGG